MIVAVDARTVFSATRRGTGKNLIDLYATLAALEPAWQFVMLHQRAEGGDPFHGLPNVRPVRVDIPGDRWNLWQDVRLPTAALGRGAGVLHCPANTAPRWAPMPVVVTIHDLIPLEVAPEAATTRRWLRRVQHSARGAAAVITPSGYSQRAIVRETGIPASRITVNPWAPDRKCQRVTGPAVLEAAAAAYGVARGQRFVLVFGAADPRKNTQGILQAWAHVPAEARRGVVLLIVGLQPDALAHFKVVAETLVPDGSYRLHGFAPEADVPALLSGAAALCYPSRSEGFGLPILDAFTCGTPVVTSTSSSLPEVAGDAALLVDPESPAEIAEALRRLLVSPDERARLQTAGLRRIDGFSWDKCARTVGAVLAKAAGMRKSER